MTRDTYPHWIQSSPSLYVSEEEVEGTPDFILERMPIDGRPRWRLKWRTSAMSERYHTAQDAKDAVRRATQ